MKKTLIAILTVLVSASCATAPRGPEVTERGVRFTLHAPNADSVAVAGSFNRWNSGVDRLSGPDEQGRWHIILPLPPGRYEYQFVVDGRVWKPDPGAPSVDDGMGGRNSLVVVEPGAGGLM